MQNHMPMTLTHTGTVVPEYFKGETTQVSGIQWKSVKWPPAVLQTHEPMVNKFGGDV